MEILEQLRQPFQANEIEWRVQQCGIKNNNPWVMVLAYVQARAIQKRLDLVFGFDGWSDEYRFVDKNIICRLGVKHNGEWVYKENGASETEIEAFKGGISGAFKRVAASGFGIGRYLYDLDVTFANCQLDSDPKLEKAKTKEKKWIYWKVPLLPDWAIPTKESKIENLTKLWEGLTKEQRKESKYLFGQLKAQIL
jgi:hypothetical protein